MCEYIISLTQPDTGAGRPWGCDVWRTINDSAIRVLVLLSPVGLCWGSLGSGSWYPRVHDCRRFSSHFGLENSISVLSCVRGE